MNIYIDESGSINKYATNDQYFVVSMIHVLDPVALERAYKRFISSNYEMLLDHLNICRMADTMQRTV